MPAATTRPKLRAELPPEAVTVLVDRREQLPLDVSPLRTEWASLPTADYSIKGMEDRVAVERKSLDDALACCGTERERFERELQRLRAFEVRALVIESDWPTIEAGGWRSKITPNVVVGSLLAWSGAGLPLILCGDHERAGRFVAKFLYLAARRRYRELRSFGAAVIENPEEPAE